MKTNHYYLLLLMALFMLPMNAQENSSSSDVTVVQAFDFFITEPVSSFPQVNVSDIPAREIPRGQMSQRRQNRADELNAAGNSPSQVDPLIQNGGFTRSGRDPIVSFDATAPNVSPPDPAAAVGPNHIVEMTNGLWSVYDKDGNIEPGYPKNVNDPLGGSGASTDPIVLYDREADRWLITRFDLPSANRFRLAVSTTPDPTGTYAVYSYNSGFNDYPHYGIWGNNYIAAGNFSPSGRIYAWNREKMLNGDATAEMVFLQLPGFVPGTVFRAPQPVHSEGAGIAAGPAPIVWFHDDAWGGVTQDAAVIWDFDIDWTNPGSATATGPLEIPLADFDSFISGTGGDAFANLQQPNTTQRIDALVHVMNFQAHRYDFGSHESMIFNFAVEPVNNTRISGLRWVEVRRSGGGDWTLYQEGTFVDPTGDESVFMGGIGMDQDGNIAMGYIKTGDTTFPSLFYTGQEAGDPLGAMSVAEVPIIAGTNSVTTNSRYGDYAQLVRDPVDDLTFWYTAEYSGQPRRIRIASFKISEALSVDELNAAETDFVITSQDGKVFDVNLLAEGTSDILRMSVHSITGQRVVYEQVEKNSNGVYSAQFNMSGAASGVYVVTIGNSKTKLSKQILVR